MPEPEKLTLLIIDDLRMDEVAVFEKMSGLTITEVFAHVSAGDSPPTGAVMALAYLTEKRANPRAKAARWQNLSFTEFTEELDKRFQFASSQQQEDGDGEDPTNAA